MRRPLNAAPRCKKPAPYNPELPALLLLVQKILHHTTEGRHTDTAGDKNEFLFRITRQSEIPRDASREYRVPFLAICEVLFERARTFIELHPEPHLGLRRGRGERKIPAVASRIRFFRRERPFRVLTGQKFRLPSRKNQFVRVRGYFSLFLQLQYGLKFRADEI